MECLGIQDCRPVMIWANSPEARKWSRKPKSRVRWVLSDYTSGMCIPCPVYIPGFLAKFHSPPLLGGSTLISCSMFPPQSFHIYHITYFAFILYIICFLPLEFKLKPKGNLMIFPKPFSFFFYFPTVQQGDSSYPYMYTLHFFPPTICSVAT